MSVFNIIDPSIIVKWLERDDPDTRTGRSVAGAWHQFLVNQTGSDGSDEDLERMWLHSEGAAGESMADLWSSYLQLNGLSSGSIEDRLRQFFNSSVVLVTFRLLKEDGFGLITESGAGALLLE